MKKFIYDSINFLIRPKKAFSELKYDNIQHAFIRTAVYSLLAGVIALVYNIANVSLSTGQEWYLTLFSPVLVAIIILILGALLLLLLAKIGKGNTDFNCCLHIVSACQVMAPINALISVGYYFDVYIGAGFHMLIGAYGLYIFYTALVHALKVDVVMAVIVYILFFCLLLFSAGIMIFQAKMMPELMKTLNSGKFYENMRKSGMDTKQLDMLKKQMQKRHIGN